MIRVSLAAILLVLCASAIAQNERVQKAPQAPIPLFDIQFSKDATASIPYPENFPAMAMQCGPHGTPYVWLFGGNGMEVIALTSDGITNFPTSKMTDIPEPRCDRFFVADSGVYVLVTGLENAKKEEVTYTDESGKVLGHRTRPVGEPHQYIARFGTDGSYKGAIKLDFPFRRIHQIAAFESGNFLVAGVDAQDVPRVAAVNSSGQLQKFIELAKDITDRPKAARAAFKKSSGEDAPIAILAMFAHFVPYRSNMLFFRSRGNTPVYEIRDGGEARAVNLKAPDGFVVDWIMPSDNNEWLVQFFKPAAGGSLTDGERAIYSVNPDSGELVSHYRLKDSDLTVACRDGGEFVGIRQKDGKLTILRGHAEPVQSEVVRSEKTVAEPI